MANQDLDTYRIAFAADIPARARLIIRPIEYGNVMAIIESRQGGMHLCCSWRIGSRSREGCRQAVGDGSPRRSLLLRFDALGLLRRGFGVIRAISILTMVAVIALLLGAHPFAVYLLGLLITVIILWEGRK